MAAAMEMVFSPIFVDVWSALWRSWFYDLWREAGPLSNGLRGFWNGLGDARGYVVGAAVTFLGVLVNVLALWGLEGYRSRRQESQAAQAWERERNERLADLRRKSYNDVVTACENRAFITSAEENEKPAIRAAWRNGRAVVRFVTDDRRLIDASDEMVTSAGEYDSADEATKQRFIDARTLFVQLSRAELGRVSLDIKTAPRGA